MTWKVIVGDDWDGNENIDFKLQLVQTSIANQRSMSTSWQHRFPSDLFVLTMIAVGTLFGIFGWGLADDYCCDCCNNDEPSEWDSDEGDFCCDIVKNTLKMMKMNAMPMMMNWGMNHEENRDWDDEEETVNVQIEIDLTAGKQSDQTYFVGVDKNTYITVPCNRWYLCIVKSVWRTSTNSERMDSIELGNKSLQRSVSIHWTGPYFAYVSKPVSTSVILSSDFDKSILGRTEGLWWDITTARSWLGGMWVSNDFDKRDFQAPAMDLAWMLLKHEHYSSRP